MFIGILFSLLASAAIIQTPVSQTPTPTTRAFLLQVLRAHLGSTTVSDLQATAQRIDSQGRREPLKIYAQGSMSMRLERGDVGSAAVSVFRNGAGWSEAEGKTEYLPEHVSKQRVTLFPFLDLLAESSNPALEVTVQESVILGSVSVWHLRLRLKDPTPEKRFLYRPLDEETDYYIDSQTLLVLRSERLVSTIQNMDLRVPLIQEFSDYRVVNGVAVPFRIRTIEGTPATGLNTWTTVLQDVEINGGLRTNIFDRGGR